MDVRTPCRVRIVYTAEALQIRRADGSAATISTVTGLPFEGVRVHWKVTSVSSAMNANTIVFASTVPDGPPVILATGVRVSTRKVSCCGVWLPARSVATARNV